MLGQKNAQLANYPRVLYVKPSNEVYVFVCYSYHPFVLVCYSYVTRMLLVRNRMYLLLVCTRMYRMLLVCYPYVTRSTRVVYYSRSNLSNLSVGRLVGLQHSSVIIYLVVIVFAQIRRQFLRECVIILKCDRNLIYCTV